MTRAARLFALLLVVQGCGRFGYDAALAGGDGGDPADGGDLADGAPGPDGASGVDASPGAPDGAALDSPELRVSQSAGTSQHPALVAAADGLRVVYDDDTSGDSDIHMARIAPDGTLAAAPVALTTASAVEGYPRAAWSGSALGVAWEDDRNGNTEVYFRRFDGNGGGLGSEARLTTTATETYNPVVAWTGSGYAIAWEDGTASNADIWIRRTDASGAPLGSALQRSTASGLSARVAAVWTGSEFGLAWEDDRSGQSDIYFARVSSSGASVGGEVPVVTAGDNQLGTTLIWTGSQYGLAWEDSRSGVSTIYFTRLDASGAPQMTPIAISGGASPALEPSLAWSGDRFGLAWAQDGLILFAALNSTGGLLEARVVSLGSSGRAEWPSLVWTGAAFAAAWHDDRTGNDEIYARLFQ